MTYPPQCPLLVESGPAAFGSWVTRRSRTASAQLRARVAFAILVEKGGKSLRRFHLSERARKSAREIGNIVLGVLIALGIGEVADAVRHRVNARRALAAVRLDMIDNVPAFDIRPVYAKCLMRRLATISRELEKARKTGLLSDIGEIGRSGTRSFRTGQWESAVSDGDTLYVDDKVVADLTDYHASLAIYNALQDEASVGWARLRVLMHAPGRIDDNTLSAARQTVAELQYREEGSTVWARAILRNHRAVGFPVVYSTFAGRPYSRPAVLRAIGRNAMCRPLQIDGRDAEPDR